MIEEFLRRRRIVVDGLNALPGVRCLEPAGAFYAFPNVEGVPLPGDVLAQRLLDEAGVATLSGSAFGRFGRAICASATRTPRPTSARRCGGCGDFLAAL